MGDVILANGMPWPVMPVTKRRYRFRLLNASLSRSFKLSLSDPNAEMWVIATDGGFMPKPVQVSNLRVGMAERYELIIDFTRCADGAEVVLRNGDLTNNVPYENTNKVMKFVVPPARRPTSPATRSRRASTRRSLRGRGRPTRARRGDGAHRATWRSSAASSSSPGRTACGPSTASPGTTS